MTSSDGLRIELIESAWIECDADRITMRDLDALLSAGACLDCDWNANGVHGLYIIGAEDLEELCAIIRDIQFRRGEDAISLHIECDDPDQEADP